MFDARHLNAHVLTELQNLELYLKLPYLYFFSNVSTASTTCNPGPEGWGQYAMISGQVQGIEEG